ncbi:type II toxin-antitoxin system RelE/ParE family toxin [Terracidiphilus gabretensis]|uniref:type II toxin-antitoxin system RelE/ParE family toxin n=1 Tax=Terracidiphilus gabretensis TaxID=1577687 RepID=UPI00071B26FE|nr:type II toxin-antitoxin system RelE/ParE family toxin [Terracidiphilus gabretensis]
MQVRWSVPAAEDLERICEWIERDSPEAARRVAQTIYHECARLKDFPYLGRASRRMEGRRELTFTPLPYIAVYQVKQDAVEISRIFHGAQDWP